MGTVKITILSDKLRGTSFTLTEETYTIGRSDAADICIAEPTISGHHCTFTLVAEGTYTIKDEGSTNGTRLNGEKLEDEPRQLKDGDLLQFGNVELLFENKEARIAAPMKTVTVINLDETGSMDITNTKLKNIGTKVSSKRRGQLRDNRKHNMILIAIISVLGIAVLCLLTILVLKLLQSK